MHQTTHISSLYLAFQF